MIPTTLRALGWLIAIAIAAGTTVFVMSSRTLDATRDVSPHRLDIRRDDGSAENGRRLVRLLGCRSCHGEDLGGGPVAEPAPFAALDAPNLTSGRGGVGGAYTVGDYERAIRHGVRPDGSPLLLMPSERYAGLADSDLADVIRHLRSIEPVDREAAEPQVGLTGRLAAVFDPQALAAGRIDHESPHVHAMAEDRTPEYGAYLAAMCRGCHGQGLPGRGSGASTGGFTAANPSPGARRWRLGRKEFERALEEGVRPDGFEYRTLSPAQVEALWTYLRRTPPDATRDH